MNNYFTLFLYTTLIAFIAINLNKAMPYMKQRWNAFITRISRKSNAPQQLPIDKKILDKMVAQAIKDKVNNGLLTYHKKQMIRDIVREEVIKYLNELKNK